MSPKKRFKIKRKEHAKHTVAFFSSRDEDLAAAIRQRQIDPIVKMMFQENPLTIKPGFHTESDLWDFKLECPGFGRQNIIAWAKIACDVLAFHNHKGGVIFFGIKNNFSISGIPNDPLDSKLVNEQLRRFLSDRIWVEFHREFIQEDQRYLGVMLISPRTSRVERFEADAVDEKERPIFKKGDSAIRVGDSSRRICAKDAETLERSQTLQAIQNEYAVSEDYYRILQPEYDEFIVRDDLCKRVDDALADPRAAITALIGIGGVGKTALATWAVLKAYYEHKFEYIISITAKDRELTPTGIKGLEPTLTSFESLLDTILEVMCFPEYKTASITEKESQVRTLLETGKGLLYVDNLETIDDVRIIPFLDSLPIGVRAITTSRRSAVRVSVRPIDVGSLTEDEALTFMQKLSSQSGFGYIADLSQPERLQIIKYCDGIPLAIRWTLARSESPQEALVIAKSISGSGKHGDELLEFCFRHIFDSMETAEKSVLNVLSIFPRSMPTDAILRGIGRSHSPQVVIDAIEDLISDAIIHRVFDADRNDYSYSLVPIAKIFVYKELSKDPALEKSIRETLASFFEAKDIKDLNERLVVREIRQGKTASESVLIDLARAAERRDDKEIAQDFYEKALQTNVRSWNAARFYGRFLNKKLKKSADALKMYEQAAKNAPTRGIERAHIFREWGLLLKDSGSPHATDLAIEKFEIALLETPNDTMIIQPLAEMLDRKGAYLRIIEVLEPFVNHKSKEVNKMLFPMLLNAYKRRGDVLKAGELQIKLRQLGI